MAYTLIGSIAAGSVAGATVETPTLNTTGATLLVVSISDAQDAGFGTVEDSKGNVSWVPLTVQTNGAFAVRSRIYYHLSPVVGTGHTFTYTISSSFQYPSINAMAFAGGHSSPFDVENGAVSLAATTLATGNVTPSQNDELIISALGFGDPGASPTIDNGFTIADTVAQQGGNHYGGSAAYKIQTTAAAVNPSWSWTGSAVVAVTIATFKVAPQTGLSVLIGEPLIGSSIF